ncbi:Transposase, partial [Phytophthora megakarya]
MASEAPSAMELYDVADELKAATSASEPLPKKRRGSGRKRDPVWEFTTVFADKRVECNRCGALIHRYGVAKVERVRYHFERKCPGVQAQVATPPPRGDEAGATAETVVMEETKHHKGPSTSYGSKSGTFKRKLALWLYATGQPFDGVGNELLLNAVRVLRSDAVLPSKHELENELLNLEASAITSKVTKALSGKKCCLTVENWVDAGGCGVTTYGAFCEGTSYYLASKTATSKKSGEELSFDEVDAVLTKEKKAEVYGIVTPTLSVLSKFTRDQIQKKYPRCMFFHGCVSNALTLLLNDVCSILPWLEKVKSSVGDLIQVFHGNHKLQTLVFAGENNTTTEFPDSSSICASLEMLLKYEKVLYTIVARRDFVDASTPADQEKRKLVQDFVLGE